MWVCLYREKGRALIGRIGLVRIASVAVQGGRIFTFRAKRARNELRSGGALVHELIRGPERWYCNL